LRSGAMLNPVDFWVGMALVIIVVDWITQLFGG
jgi:hypothetical protein